MLHKRTVSCNHRIRRSPNLRAPLLTHKGHEFKEALVRSRTRAMSAERPYCNRSRGR